MVVENKYLIFVGIDGVQSNKYYNMIPNGDTFIAEYGRIDSSKSTKTYPIGKWNSVYNSKTRKGYKDITDLKKTTKVIAEDSGNKVFDDFYSTFSKYTGNMVKKTFLVEGCSQGQIDEAQDLLNKISRFKKVDTINKYLLELYKVIPRRMADVRAHLIKDPNEIQKLLQREQEALDSMDSSNIMNVSNPYKELGIDFKEGTKEAYEAMERLLYPTMGYYKHKIHKVYGIMQQERYQKFNQWLDKQEDKTDKFLIHGTRNPNIFSILKSGLMIRPTNAAVISGAAYGNGIYHSAHTAKSLGYTGSDNDKIFFIQNVHVGKAYEYSGWYRDGKDISRNQMNYEGLQKLGCDSLYVKAGDGLLNSEYIVYKEEQSYTSFLVWLK